MKLLKLTLATAAILAFSNVNAQKSNTKKSDAEIKKFVEERFSQIDANSDKSITLKEMIRSDKKSSNHDKSKSKNKFKSMDANEDGAITFKEFSTRLTAYLKKQQS